MKTHIEELFDTHKIEVAVQQLDSPAEFSLAARTAVQRGAGAVVAGGGDGTISAVASVLAGGSTPLGVLPLGTLNHFAKDLQIPIDLDKAVETIARNHVRRVDVGRLGDRVFLNNSSIGIYPSIVEQRERLRRRGQPKWIAFAKATFDVVRRGDEVSIRIESDAARIAARTPFLFIGNNEYQGEGLHLGTRTRLDGGQLHVYFAPPVDTRDLPKLFAYALLGRAREDYALESLSTAELWLETPSAREIKVACDGELLRLKPPLHYRAWPGALNVITPAA